MIREYLEKWTICEMRKKKYVLIENISLKRLIITNFVFIFAKDNQKTYI